MRERGRKRETDSMCVFVCEYVCVCVCERKRVKKVPTVFGLMGINLNLLLDVSHEEQTRKV